MPRTLDSDPDGLYSDAVQKSGDTSINPLAAKFSRRGALKMGALGVLGGLVACSPIASTIITNPGREEESLDLSIVTFTTTYDQDRKSVTIPLETNGDPSDTTIRVLWSDKARTKSELNPDMISPQEWEVLKEANAARFSSNEKDPNYMPIMDISSLKPGYYLTRGEAKAANEEWSSENVQRTYHFIFKT